ncbi:endonuclease domain-containing protein [Modestobacter sp. I12A-02662]|uniref:endonuclease domain-containing protein n=1 Tax=Modestobacter sp. I12A-02662 TaxID=1730496 RepID=UPI0034DF8F43
MVPRISGLDGVFIGAHAISEGVLTRHQLRTGAYRRVLRGVYTHPAVTVDHSVIARAASLLIPAGTAIGGASAVWWHGGPLPDPSVPVTVVLPEGIEWTGPRGIRVHRTRLRPGEVVDRAGVPVTVAARTAWDVCALESVRTAVAALDAMVRSRALSRLDLQRLVRSGVGRWGAARVRRAVDLVDERSESPPESWLRVAFVLAGLPPCVPQFDVVADGVFLARVDFAWPEARLVVEYEGAYHFEGVQVVRDDRRIARLLAAGWRVIRVSAADLRDLDAVVERVRVALRAAPTAG